MVHVLGDDCAAQCVTAAVRCMHDIAGGICMLMLVLST